MNDNFMNFCLAILLFIVFIAILALALHSKKKLKDKNPLIRFLAAECLFVLSTGGSLLFLVLRAYLPDKKIDMSLAGMIYCADIFIAAMITFTVAVVMLRFVKITIRFGSVWQKFVAFTGAPVAAAIAIFLWDKIIALFPIFVV